MNMMREGKEGKMCPVEGGCVRRGEEPSAMLCGRKMSIGNRKKEDKRTYKEGSKGVGTRRRKGRECRVKEEELCQKKTRGT